VDMETNKGHKPRPPLVQVYSTKLMVYGFGVTTSYRVWIIRLADL
jgi:hypothetical protein